MRIPQWLRRLLPHGKYQHSGVVGYDLDDVQPLFTNAFPLTAMTQREMEQVHRSALLGVTPEHDAPATRGPDPLAE